MDDNEAFDHIQNIGTDAPNLDTFVQRLLLEQLDGNGLHLTVRPQLTDMQTLHLCYPIETYSWNTAIACYPASKALFFSTP
jgi:hypothetical protein